MAPDADIPYGTLDLMVLKTLDSMGPLHGYGIARRIEQVAQGSLALNQGTIYPALLRLEQKGWIKSESGASENNRRARFYEITRAGKKQLAAETESFQVQGSGGSRGADSRDSSVSLSSAGLGPLEAERRGARRRDSRAPRPADLRAFASRPVADGGSRGGAARLRRRRSDEGAVSRSARVS